MSKIWYKLPTNKPYPVLEDTFHLHEDNFSRNLDLIDSAIENFNSKIHWQDMWTQQIAVERLSKGEDLFIYAPFRLSKAFVWFKENYLYNFFVSPEVRKDGIGEKIIKHAYNILPYKTFYAYTESWNKVTQNFTKKRVGGIEISYFS